MIWDAALENSEAKTLLHLGECAWIPALISFTENYKGTHILKGLMCLHTRI